MFIVGKPTTHLICDFNRNKVEDREFETDKTEQSLLTCFVV